MERQKLIKCRVTIDKIIFPKTKMESGDWASFSCSVLQTIEGEPKLSSYGNIKCRGHVPKLSLTDTYILIAKPEIDPKYGMQYQVVSINTEYPLETKEQQEAFLSKILSEKQINALFTDLEDPMRAIQSEDYSSLCAVKGIKLSTAEKIVQRYKDNIDNSRAYVELDKFGLTKRAIDKLLDQFNSTDTIIQKITENPYFLLTEVDGYGWNKADAIALNMGIDPLSLKRIGGYVVYLLQQRSQLGNTVISPQELYETVTSELPEVSGDMLKEVLYKLYEKEIIWWDEDKTMMGLVDTYVLEDKIAKELLRLSNAPSSLKPSIPLERVMEKIEEENGWELTDEQIEAIKRTATSNVSIITGFAGSGKSSVVSAILRHFNNSSFAQTALAGRAAARLGEVTGEDGYTIHRLLESAGRKGFKRNKYNQLDQSIIILDEVSMVGGQLFYSLVRAVRDGCKLIMLGDVGQLESIGFLNLFHDMMDSGVITTSHLTKIHRQAQRSAIITTSMAVREQTQIFPRGFTGREIRGDLQDLELDIYDEPILTQKRVANHFKKMISDGMDIMEVQVIVPMKQRGDSCTFALNPILQKIANPTLAEGIKIEKGEWSYELKIGDKVINTRNNYKTIAVGGGECPIFNGNLGIIEEVDPYEGNMIVYFEQWGSIKIPKKHWAYIELGYAITCHKFQGSQSTNVIIGLDFSAFTMLTKEWLYTAITRAQKYCVLCGENKAISYAIKKSNIPHKQTILKDLLLGKEYYQYNSFMEPKEGENYEESA